MGPKSIPAERTSVSYIPIKSHLKGLSIDVFIFIVSKLWVWRYAKKSKIQYFSHIILNLNISVTINVIHLIFSMTILDIMRAGTVSQICYS